MTPSVERLLARVEITETIEAVLDAWQDAQRAAHEWESRP